MADKSEPSLRSLISQMISEVAEDICDNYCRYSDTANEEALCDIILTGGDCPLDRLF